MKKCYSHRAGPAYYRMCSATFTVQNKPAAVAPKETITHHFFVSEIWAEEKLSMQPNSVAAQENVVKTETQQTFVNGLRLAYYFRHLYPAGSAVYCSQ